MSQELPKSSSPDSITRQYNHIGDAYIEGKEAFFKNVRDLGKEFLTEHLKNPQEKSLLDVGCGAGAELVTYRDEMHFKQVLGVDPSLTMVQAAQKVTGDTAIAQLGDWEHLPVPDASQDYVLGRFSFHYVEKTDAPYREAARVLRSGGELILILPHPVADIRAVENGKEVIKTSLYGGKVVVTYPPHSMNDYLSPTFEELFELVEKREYKSLERDTDTSVDSLVIVARKR